MLSGNPDEHERAGRSILALGLAALLAGSAGYAVAEAQAWPLVARHVALGWPALLAAGAAGLALGIPVLAGKQRWPLWVAAAFWAFELVRVAGPLRSASALTDLVSPLEYLALALASTGAALGTRTRAFMAVVAATLALMLALFGAIHLRQASDISGLIPAWFPARAEAPYVTGTILLLAALTLPVSRARTAASCAVALMFGSWLGLIHAPRLLAAPDSVFEWQFASMALALTGALLLLAGSSLPLRAVRIEARGQPAAQTWRERWS